MDIITTEYNAIDSYKIAKNAKKRYRDKLGIDKSESLGYGEIDLDDFYRFYINDILPLIIDYSPTTATTATAATTASSIAASKIKGEDNLSSASASSEGGGNVSFMEINKNLVDNKYIFFDCGSGSGRAVHIAAYATASDVFKNVPLISKYAFVGVEILEDLHDIAISVNKKLIEANKIIYDKCKFVLDDSFSDDSDLFWYNSSVIFIPCTLFTDELMDNVYKKIQSGNIKSGTILISTTRKLILPTKTDVENKKLKITIEHLSETRRKYAKGSLTFNIYKVHNKTIAKDL